MKALVLILCLASLVRGGCPPYIPRLEYGLDKNLEEKYRRYPNIREAEEVGCGRSNVAPAVGMDRCPANLRSVDEAALERFPQMREAVETACGRRNFTMAFWNPALYNEFMNAQRKIFSWKYSNTPCNLECSKERFSIDVVSFIPLMRPYHERMRAPGKEYVNNFLNMAIRKDESGTSSVPKDWVAQLESDQGANILPMAFHAQNILVEGLKATFGIVETVEMRRSRIDTAMRALVRSAATNRTAYSIAMDRTVTCMLNLTQVLQKKSFAQCCEEIVSVLPTAGIGYLEITPALEALYLQSRTLDNARARIAMNAVLTFLKSSYERDAELPEGHHQSLSDKNYMAISLFDLNFGEEARAALHTAFPELMDYLEKNGFESNVFEEKEGDLAGI